jgi:hypothetical protein
MALHIAKRVLTDGETTELSIWLSMLEDMPAFLAMYDWVRRILSLNCLSRGPIFSV